VSAAMDRRLGRLEAAAILQRGDPGLAKWGRQLRGVCEQYGIPCWPAAEDATFREWSWEHAGAELRSWLHIVWADAIDAARARPIAGVDVDSLENPWEYDDEALSRVIDSEGPS